MRLRAETRREGILLLLIVLVLLGFSLIIENYLSARLFNRVTASVAILAILAIGQTLVVLTRNIDLSVGSIVGFTAYFVGQQLSIDNDIHPLVAVLMAVGLGAALGAFNGVIVAYCRVPAIIVTLGTLALYRTLLVEYSDAQTILTVNLPQWLIDLPRLNVASYERFHLRVVVAAMLTVAVLFQLLLRHSSFGRRLYAIGSSPEAAHNAGFPTQRLVLAAFVLCGALAGSPGSSSSPGSATSRWWRASGSSSSRSPRWWSAGSTSSAAPGAFSARCWGRS